MEKRLIVAIILSFLVLMGYQYFFVKPNRPAVPQPASSAAAPEAQAQVPGGALPVPGTQKPAAEPKAAPAGENPPAPSTTAPSRAETGRIITVKTSLYTAQWLNEGGLLKSWKLSRFKDLAKAVKDKTTGQLIEPRQIEMVPAAAALGRYPFALGSDDPALDVLNTLPYEVQATPGPDAAGVLDVPDGTRGEIAFKYSDGASLQAEKIFRFTGGSYAVDMEIKVWKDGKPVPVSVIWGPGIDNPREAEQKQGFSTTHGSAVYTGGKVVRMSERKYNPDTSAYNFVTWAAYEENYFVALFLLSPQKEAQFRRQTQEGQAPAYFLYAADPTRAFIGPKDIDLLKAFGHDAQKVIKFGAFGIVAEFTLVITKFFYRLVPNWGIAIILLTVLIKILFFPLTYSSTKSMSKMADLQPKVKALRAKYKKAKTDIEQRKQMNEEMMKLYKEHGVNPAGGCLPLLIQLPVFWGVFQMLVVAVEFRHAPFALWITDLSTKDPYLVTPILMGITQYISQKMTPTSADPAQAKMMLIMPFVMTIFFINFQSGLVLYWLTTNVLQIGQQALMNKMMHRHPATAKAR